VSGPQYLKSGRWETLGPEKVVRQQVGNQYGLIRVPRQAGVLDGSQVDDEPASDVICQYH